MRTTLFSILALGAVLAPSFASADTVSDRSAAVSLCRSQVAQQAGVDLVSVRLTNVRAVLRNVRVDLSVRGSQHVRCDVTRGQDGALQVASITPPIQTASAQ
ncbi:MAG: hypothetical protein HY054_06830 [Proteobacteria bacterium]|nr:hypothetical protein [Pseudomonadota bacterium]